MPFEPTTVSEYVPLAAVPSMSSVRVDVAIPSGGGVTGLGLNEGVTPLGAP